MGSKQKDIIKAWTKMELNSSYGLPSVPVTTMVYDKNNAFRITEEGRKNLMMIQKVFKNIL